MKKKGLVFFQYLPPWRIDVFNYMAKYYNLTICFTNANISGFTYNNEYLNSKLIDIDYHYVTKGLNILGRPIRIGISKFIFSLKPDIIFSHEFGQASILAVLIRKLKLSRFKLIITTSDNLEMVSNESFFKSLIRKFVLNNSDGIIVYSFSVKNWYRKKFPKLVIKICPNIQNPDSLLSYKIEFPSIVDSFKIKFNLLNSKIILFVGRIEHVKGLDLLIHAFSKVSFSDVKLVIVGEGSEKNNLIDLIQRLRLNDKVIFPGSFSGSYLYAWYDIADLFVLPSRFEPFGAVVNEALVFGCPVLASKYIGAIDFIENGKNGYIFDPMNELDFIEVIELGLNRFSTARKNLMLFSFKECVLSYYEIFNEI